MDHSFVHYDDLTHEGGKKRKLAITICMRKLSRLIFKPRQCFRDQCDAHILICRCQKPVPDLVDGAQRLHLTAVRVHWLGNCKRLSRVWAENRVAIGKRGVIITSIDVPGIAADLLAAKRIANATQTFTRGCRYAWCYKLGGQWPQTE